MRRGVVRWALVAVLGLLVAAPAAAQERHAVQPKRAGHATRALALSPRAQAGIAQLLDARGQERSHAMPVFALAEALERTQDLALAVGRGGPASDVQLSLLRAHAAELRTLLSQLQEEGHPDALRLSRAVGKLEELLSRIEAVGTAASAQGRASHAAALEQWLSIEAPSAGKRLPPAPGRLLRFDRQEDADRLNVDRQPIGPPRPSHLYKRRQRPRR